MEKSLTNSPAASPLSPGASPAAWKDRLIEYAITHGGQIISALIIIIVGVLAARWIGNLVQLRLEKKNMEPPVRMLLVRLLKLFVFICAFLVALGTAGVDVTVLIAGFSVAGVGVGLALQGVLGNLFAGLTIIFTKPFRVGEYIELLNVQGQVNQIELLATTLLHTDRSRVVIPNRKIIGEILHNYGTVRQIELSVGVAYGANLSEALLLINQILKSNARVLQEFEPVVGVSSLGSSSIDIAIKPWVKVGDVGPAGAEIYQSIVAAFRERKIEIPFPQQEVRLLNPA